MIYTTIFYDPQKFEEFCLRYWNVTRLPSRRMTMLWRVTK